MKGILTALITPFRDGKVDFASLEKLVQFQLENKVDGFIISGTTGESPTLTALEKKEIFQLVKKLVPKNFPLIMGTGTNSTESSIAEAIEAERIGADACLVVVPYYNKPPQRGLFEHFKTIASKIEIPVILYNVPSRTITSLEIDTIKKLSEHPNILGIKEASGNIEFARQIREICGKQFLLLSGDDGTYADFMQAGGDGVISVASHILPLEMKQQKIKENRALIDFLFCESNPIPLKMALYYMKIISSPELRLPLVNLGPDKSEQLKVLLRQKGLIQ